MAAAHLHGPIAAALVVRTVDRKLRITVPFTTNMLRNGYARSGCNKQDDNGDMYAFRYHKKKQEGVMPFQLNVIIQIVSSKPTFYPFCRKYGSHLTVPHSTIIVVKADVRETMAPDTRGSIPRLSPESRLGKLSLPAKRQ